MSDNPYSPPASSLEIGSPEREFSASGPRSVTASRGYEWVVESFQLVFKSPGGFILSFIILGLMAMVANFIPLASLAFTVITPVLIGGYMRGCAATDRGGSMSVDQLFEGFNQEPTDLIVLGLISLGLQVLTVIVGLIFGAGLLFATGILGSLDAFDDPSGLGLGILLIGLIVAAIALPVQMALYFATPLVALGGVKPTVAIRMSFSGCLMNIVPFLVFSLVLLVVLIIALIPLGLGLVVVIPVLMASIYVGYKDIYVS